jgi:hypothetical protein
LILVAALLSGMVSSPKLRLARTTAVLLAAALYADRALAWTFHARDHGLHYSTARYRDSDAMRFVNESPSCWRLASTNRSFVHLHARRLAWQFDARDAEGRRRRAPSPDAVVWIHDFGQPAPEVLSALRAHPWRVAAEDEVATVFVREGSTDHCEIEE